MVDPLKLDIGCGPSGPRPGHVAIDRCFGTEAFPLAYANESVDAIVASHILEHFPHRQVPDVLKEWARVLKPGGQMKIAVPNLGWIAENYIAGQPINTQGYLMGGQVDEADFHKSAFDAESLRRQLAAAGLMLIREWTSDLNDCAALPVSLNLGGTKPHQSEIGVSAVMSVPRLGFMDNFMAAFEALPPLNIKLRRYTGAYWSQCIERVIEETIEKDAPDAVLTLDYDSIFSRRDASMLMQLLCCYPQADAIAAVQSGRGKTAPLFTVESADGDNRRQMHVTEFSSDLTAVSTAHFGLTLIRTEKLKAMGKPWFHDVPDENGTWGPGRVDADINFWRKWQATGNSLFIANRVPIGHLELQILWPGRDLAAITQPVSDWRENGRPEGAWQ